VNKKRLTKILAKASSCAVRALSADIKKEYQPIMVKEPSKALAMIKMREPVQQSNFYIGEVIICEAAVEIQGVLGSAVSMTDDRDKVLDMAIIDAAVNLGVFTGMDALRELEQAQNSKEMQENALHLKTMVNFESMDGEVPSDLASQKKA